ncbi:MAG: sensor histidine kinase [Sulfuritalea sp.]|nr:sensor histidine kinase [Sulfuritalea sp.]
MSLSALRGSLRLRLLAGTLFWIAASILVAGWGLGSLFRQHVASQFHAELTTHLDQLTAQLALDAQGRPSLALPLSDPRLSRPYSGYYWQIDVLGDTGGKPAAAGLLRSRSLWDHVLAVPPDTLADGEIHRHRVPGPEGRMLGMVERSVRIDDAADGKPRRMRLIAAADERFMAEPVARFSGTLWLALGALGIGLVIAALVQVFVGLAPLRSVRAALGKVRSGDTQKLEGAFPREIEPLIEEFNTVLAQNAAVVERARTHAGNLAHALKTPLSVLANAANAGDDAAHPELARLVVEQVAIAQKQVDYHLARAQAAATSRVPGARTPLHAVVEGLVRAMRRIHAEREIEIVIRPFPESLSFRGEAQDLQEMLGNLLDNACKWASRKVELDARSEGPQLIVTIDDDGSGLAAERRDAVMHRGVRADQQVPGSGLGLAIVDDLARLYGGQVHLGDSPAGGLRAELTLPSS